MTPPGGSRRRRYPRLTVRIQVAYGHESGGETTTAVATTLGAGGLFIPTDAPLARGTKLRVRFRLPHSEEVQEMAARVVWANDRDTPGAPCADLGMGLAFLERPAITRLARDLETLARASEGCEG